MDNRILILISGLLLTGSLQAQQLAPFSTLYAQPILTNPAYVGHYDDPQAFLLFRKQWVGIPDSPETQLFNIDGDIAENMGLGLMIMNDRQNILGRFGGYLSYKYNIRINDNQDLSFGIQGGAFQNQILFDRINADDNSDEVLFLNEESKLVPDVNFGMLYRWKRLEIGLSAYQLLGNTVTHENQSTFQETNFKLIRHFNASVRYQFNVNDYWSIDPMVNLRSVQGMQLLGDLAVFANRGEQYWFGAGYRYNSDAFVSVGANIFGKVNLSYVYEYPLSDIAPHTGGSHEAVIGFNFVKTEVIQNRRDRQMQKRLKELQYQNREQYERMEQLNQEIKNLSKQLLEAEKQAGENTADTLRPSNNSSQSIDQSQLDQLREELLEKLKEQAEIREQIPSEIENGNGFESKREELRKNSAVPMDQRDPEKERMKRKLGAKEATADDIDDILKELKRVKVDEPDKYNYHVVLGAYFEESDAAYYQEYLTEEGIQTKTVKDEKRSYIYVTTSHVNDLDAAVKELESKMEPGFLINGNPWVYKELK